MPVILHAYAFATTRYGLTRETTKNFSPVKTPSGPRQIRLFIIDPRPLIAAALHHLFAANRVFAVVGTAQTVKPLRLRTVSPDVVLLSEDHGSTDIRELVDACRDAVPAAKVCIVANHTHARTHSRILEAGADGHALTDTGPAELMNTVIALHDEASAVYPRIGVSAYSERAAAYRPRAATSLSDRETEVLKLIADGYSNREISIALCLSEKTIKNHISRIFSKLHITARTQAVIHAIKTGIA